MARYAAKGTLLKLGSGSPTPTFATVAQVISITGPGITVDTIEMTDHDNTTGYKEFLPSFKDGGEVTLELYFDPAHTTHGISQGLLGAIGAVRDWQLVFPTSPSTQWTFKGIITRFEPSANATEALTASCTIKVTGAPTLS